MRCRNVWCRFGPVSIKSRCVETTLNLQQQFTLLVSSRRPNSSFKIRISFFLFSSALLCPFVALPARQPTKLPSLTPPPAAALQIHPTNDHHHCRHEPRLGKGWIGKEEISSLAKAGHTYILKEKKSADSTFQFPKICGKSALILTAKFRDKSA